MRYKYFGEVHADIVFQVGQAMNMTMPGLGTFVMPVQGNPRGLTGRDKVFHLFEGEVEGANPNTALQNATKMATYACQLLGLEVGMGVGTPGIKRVEPAEAPSPGISATRIGIATMSASAYLVKGFNNNANSHIGTYALNLANTSTDDRLRKLSLVNRYVDAAAARDEVTKFWHLYILLVVMTGALPSRERSAIDALLLQHIPNIPTRYSDYDNRARTITICVRDSFSHKATFDNGSELPLDQSVRLSNQHVLPLMQQLVIAELR